MKPLDIDCFSLVNAKGCAYFGTEAKLPKSLLSQIFDLKCTRYSNYHFWLITYRVEVRPRRPYVDIRSEAYGSKNSEDYVVGKGSDFK